ncbi:hypothetical protein ABK040_011458 [Willaertia magna]
MSNLKKTNHSSSSSNYTNNKNNNNHSERTTTTTTTSTSNNNSNSSGLDDFPIFNNKNFSKPNPRTNLKPPKLFFNHEAPKQTIETDRTSLLQRYFEKLNTSQQQTLQKRNNQQVITPSIHDRPQKTLKQ